MIRIQSGLGELGVFAWEEEDLAPRRKERKEEAERDENAKKSGFAVRRCFDIFRDPQGIISATGKGPW